MKKIWVVVIAVVCAGVFFYVGMVYGKSAAPAAAGRGTGSFTFSSSTRAGFAGRGGTGGGATVGQIISVSPNSVTVQLPTGSSEVVFYSSSTQVIKTVVGSAGDLTNGAQVTVMGTANSDGSVTAQAIQIRPAGVSGFGGGFGGGAGTSSTTNAGN